MKNKVNNIAKFTYIILLIILIVYLISGLTIQRYYYYPTLRIYPDNKDEVKIVENYIKKRDNEMLNFIKLTDKTVCNAFIKIFDIDSNINISIDELLKIENEIVELIMFLKFIFNRARPKQINPSLQVYKSISANTPAFPSGHTCQAFYIAKKLSAIYPEKKNILYNLAEKCGQARIYAGLHYPSDHEFSKWIINLI